MPLQCAIWLLVEGDLRFFSHHDLLRAMERVISRAGLPVKYSQGFNPHPRLSLVCPRPVGVASRGEPLVVTLDDSYKTGNTEEFLAAMNNAAPRGLQFTRSELIPADAPRRSLRQVDYELPLCADRLPGVTTRLHELADPLAWQIYRQQPQRRGRAGGEQALDLRPMIVDLRLEGGCLRWSHVSKDDRWARPSEVLSLVGLDERIDLALAVRTVHWN